MIKDFSKTLHKMFRNIINNNNNNLMEIMIKKFLTGIKRELNNLESLKNQRNKKKLIKS